MKFTYQPRELYNSKNELRSFATLQEAVAHGMRQRRLNGTNEAFDVSVDSGAIVWVWEMRD